MQSVSATIHISYVKFISREHRCYPKIQEHDHTEHDPVISEYFKVVILDIFQQELDRDDRHDKGNRLTKS